MEDIVKLMQEGRRLKNKSKPVLAKTSFAVWLQNGSEYLLKNFGHQLAAQWEAMPDASCLVRGGHYYDDEHAWNTFHRILDQRLQWLGNLPSQSTATVQLPFFGDVTYLDPELKARCLLIVSASPHDPKVWDSAVRTAGVVLEDRLRAVGRVKDGSIGRDLVNKVFGREGTLASDFEFDSEREGFRDLFAGVVGVFRNPSAHRLIDPNPEEGSAYIMFVNLLLKHLDKLDKAVPTTREHFLAACSPSVAEFFRGALDEAAHRTLQIKFGTKGFTLRAHGQPCFFYCYPAGAIGRPTAVIEIYLKEIATVDDAMNTEMRVRFLEIAGTKASGDYTIRMAISDETLSQAAQLFRVALDFMDPADD